MFSRQNIQKPANFSRWICTEQTLFTVSLGRRFQSFISKEAPLGFTVSDACGLPPWEVVQRLCFWEAQKVIKKRLNQPLQEKADETKTH